MKVIDFVINLSIDYTINQGNTIVRFNKPTVGLYICD